MHHTNSGHGLCWIFCSRSSVWSFLSTKWKRFSTGLQSGLRGGVTPLRSPSWTKRFHLGLLLLLITFANCFFINFAKNGSSKCSFILLTQNNSFYIRDNHKKWASSPPCFDFFALAVHSKFIIIHTKTCHWSKMLKPFFQTERLERSVTNKIPFLQCGLKAYRFLFYTFLTALVVTLFIPER